MQFRLLQTFKPAANPCRPKGKPPFFFVTIDEIRLFGFGLDGAEARLPQRSPNTFSRVEIGAWALSRSHCRQARRQLVEAPPQDRTLLCPCGHADHPSGFKNPKKLAERMLGVGEEP